MSRARSWLAGRAPAPPAPLAQALGAVLSEPIPAGTTDGVADVGEGGLSRALTEHARARLEQALARPGRERESAYRLLEADALFTYACEAALEEADRESSLRRILTIAGTSR